MVVLLFAVNLSLCAGLIQTASASTSESEGGIVQMNFHAYSLLYYNSNMSLFIYRGADTRPPVYTRPLSTVVSCSFSSFQFRQFLPSSAQALFADADLWFGGILWITQPLTENMTVRGNMSMTVWMSTPDASVKASEYIFGVTELDSTANPVGEPTYGYYHNNGSVLGSTANPYRLAIGIDRTFASGHIIAFIVGVGSSTKGWRYQVYFDSASTNSFAELPILNVPIPEFSQVGVAVSMSFAVLCSYLIRRRRN